MLNPNLMPASHPEMPHEFNAAEVDAGRPAEEALEQTGVEPFNYLLLKAHKRTDGSWKTADQLRMEYIQLTDGLVYAMTEGVQVTDPETKEQRVEKPDVVVWLDKSARPLAWLTKELWPTLAADPESGEVPEMPDFKFVNIDREQWLKHVDPQDVGHMDVNRIDKNTIRGLRSIFLSPKQKEAGITEAIDTEESELDNKTILIVDEVYSSGRTLNIAQQFFKRAFPTSRVAGKHWMQSTTIRGGASGNKDLPVWYKDDDVTGRGVGNRNEKSSLKSSNITQRLGAYFLGTRLPQPDPDSRQLRRELHQLAVDPQVPILPSFERPKDEIFQRLEALNHMPSQEVLAKMREIKSQRY